MKVPIEVGYLSVSGLLVEALRVKRWKLVEKSQSVTGFQLCDMDDTGITDVFWTDSFMFTTAELRAIGFE